MKILSIHVQSFGKLSNVDLSFFDGVNVMRNVNGFGKTTMANFIRAMLYGFTYKTAGGVKDSARFAPWQRTGRFGGSMTVEHDGQVYRIERFFGYTQRQETLTVTNDKTGKPLELHEMQPGEFLLGLTAESYDRSAYFPQEAVELSSNDNFDSRLANLIQNGADDYDKIQDKLRAYKKSYRYERGNGGKIYELDVRKRDLLQKQSEAERAERRALEIDKSLAQIKSDGNGLVKQQEQHKRRQAELQREVAQSQASPEQQRAAARLAELNEAIRRVPAEFDKDVEACGALAKQIENAKPQQQSKKRSVKTMLYFGIAMAVIGVVFLALGIGNVLGTIAYTVGAIGLALGAVGIAGHFILTYSAKSQTSSVATSREGLIANYVGIVSKYVYVDGTDYETAKQRLWEAYKKYGEDVRERDALRSVVKAPQTDTQKAENELNEINKALADADKQLNELAMQAGRLTEERKGLTFDSVAIEDELLTVAEERAEAEFEFLVADTVSQLLAEAKDNLSSSYLPKLCARCSELLSQITDSNYAVVVDRSFNVKIREQGQTRDMSEFSRGIREITLLCFRVALSELLYDGAIPFIIIDDAFVNFDERNFARATNLLKQLSTHAQVVYFTCHDRIGELLK